MSHRTVAGSAVLVPLLMLLAAAAWAASPSTPSAPAQGGEAENIVFILDASGSMSQKIDKRAKMEIAKEVMSGLVRDLPSGINVGLTAYGHRKKEDCNDVEELAPLSLLDNAAREALQKKIAGMKNLGRTPIAGSVTRVADALKNSGRAGTIVLVSDGEETCQGDPCALVRQLKASGMRFVMHVIGFDVDEKTKAQLVCIAEAGGGKYFGAKNADELLAATRQVVQKTEAASGVLRLTAVRDGKPLDATFDILAEGAEKARVTYGRTGLEGSSVKLMPGSYVAEVVNDRDAARPRVKVGNIKIEAGKTVKKTAEFSGGKLTLKAVRDGKPLDATFALFAQGVAGQKGARVTYGRTGQSGAALDLPAGVYEVEVTNDKDAARPTIRLEHVEVQAAAAVEKTAEFSGGKLTLKASLNGKPLDAIYTLFVKAAAGEKPTRVTYGRSGQNGEKLELPPGTYEAEVTYDKSPARPVVRIEKIEIKPGAAEERTAEFTGGKLILKASLGGKPLDAIYTLFVKAAAGKSRVTYGRTGQNGETLELPPGTYEAEVTNDKDRGRPTVKLENINVQAAASLERTAGF